MDVALPDDLLANILSRLPPCSLAVSRCVRKNWCSLIDGRRLLRADLLSLRLDAFFFRSQLGLVTHPYFFSPPLETRRISGRLDFIDGTNYLEYLLIGDHCNGLLLFDDLVANPATRQLVHIPESPLPPLSPWWTHLRMDYCLVYDPMAVSPHHFEIFCVPLYPDLDSNSDDGRMLSGLLPLPSTCTTLVFSSRRWRWEKRSFVREGGGDQHAGETTADLRFHPGPFQRPAVYSKGAIYVHCKNNSLMRITLSNDKYQMIESPVSNDNVWLLNGSSSCGGPIEWVLKTNANLEAVMDNFPPNCDCDKSFSTPWIVFNYVTKEARQKAHNAEELEWDFENGIILETNGEAKENYHNIIFFLGFHPYKEIAFFWVPHSRAVSYHLNTSKVQDRVGFLRTRN
uniref:F-box domain-containing protein n=1 Tax=Leersia perrieri TaxID=77586 RepID=A0A0D9VC90_9ORYZ